MGYRTVVMLSNDRCSEWQNDAELGRKIAVKMNDAMGIRGGGDIGYGTVVECVHADTQTLAILDMYDSFHAIAHGSWVRGQSDNDVALKLLKEAASNLGYRLVRKSRTSLINIYGD
jgi:hypothetical protein